MKKSKLLVMLMILISAMLLLTACSEDTAEERFEEYIKVWESKEYEEMYALISKESKEKIGKDEFLERYTNIYDGIGAENIEVEIIDIKEDGKDIKFKLNMDTLAGELNIDDYKVNMTKEELNGKDTWLVEWDESLIFPEMEKEDLVRVERLTAKRGEIFDKDGNGLAINGKRISVGIFPAEYEDLNNELLANLLDIDKEIIEEKLKKNINPQHFVPLVKIAAEDTEMSSKLSEIVGIKQQEVNDRIYPGGEAFGNLIGYTTAITAEELEEDEENVYHSTSKIGKFGLEQVNEKHLRAKDGVEIYISKLKDGGGEEKVTLAKIEPEDGENLDTSIDTELQKNIYAEMDGDIGSSVAIEPKTGNILAMVSFPSFDSNLYTTYITNSQSKKWDEMDSNVFQNKFNKAYSPGSTFKIITSSIGLETGTIDPSEKIVIEGKSWQKDASWGDYEVSRVSQKLSNLDLNEAIVYSDNIYFARAALNIGEESFLEEANEFGFNEELPVEYPFAISQIANDGKIGNEILLADTGYGQGEVLMSPLHLSLVYSMVVNDGNIMEPTLSKGKEAKTWKENLISDENRVELLDSFINVIENKDGTAHEAKIDGIRLAGKTGTAEFKMSQEDKGKENGWFVAMNVDEPKVVITTMVEDVENRGGSHYIVPKVRNIMEEYLK